MALIQTELLTKTYGSAAHPVRALDQVNLAIDAGEFVAIMGPSGSGKSTLLYLIGGLDRPTSGTIRLRDADLSALSDEALSRLRRTSIGFVFQFFNLLPVLTARENVTLPLILDGVSRAAALVTNPALILADEPTGNLDSQASDEIVQLLCRAVDDWQRTIVIVTHDPRIAAHADRIVFLKDGRIVDENRLKGYGDAEQIRSRLGKAIVA